MRRPDQVGADHDGQAHRGDHSRDQQLAEPESAPRTDHQPQPRRSEQRDGRAEVRAEVGETREHSGAEEEQEPPESGEHRRNPERCAHDETDLDVPHPVEPSAIQLRATEQRCERVRPALQRLDHEEDQDGRADRCRRQERGAIPEPKCEQGENRGDEHEERQDGGVGDGRQTARGERRDS